MSRTIKDLIDAGQAIRGVPVRLVHSHLMYEVSHQVKRGIVLKGVPGSWYNPDALTVDEAALSQKDRPS